jgi:hypothetical protein
MRSAGITRSIGLVVGLTVLVTGLGAVPAAAAPVPLDSLTLQSSAPVAVYGQTVTFTATLTGSGAAPTGSVDFVFDEGFPLCAGVALVQTGASTATAQCVVTSNAMFGVGVWPVQVIYLGDSSYDVGVSDPVDQVIGKADSAVTVGTTGSPSTWGQAVTFTATVAAVAPGAGIPGGTVAFRADGGVITGCGAKALVAGTASCATAALALGAHSVTATYSGSGNFDGSTAALAGGQSVGNAATTSTVVSGTPTAVRGQPVTFTATVASAAGTPTGSVAFAADGVTVAGCETQALTGGVATCTTAGLGVGSHPITATYAGSASFAASAADPITETVLPAATTTTLGSSVQPSVFGQPVTFTATVAVTAPGAAPLDGTVRFRDGGATIAGCGAVAVGGLGTAECVTTALARAAHDVTAVYSGGSATASSTSNTVAQTVDRAAVALSLVVSDGPTDPGAPVTLTAQANAVAPGAGTPSGTVSFRSGSTILGTRSLGPSGAATLVTSALAPGAHDLVADVAAGPSFAAGTSAPVAHRVRYPTTVVVTASANPALPGRAIQLRAAVTSTAGVPDQGTVTFALDGAPVGSPVPVDTDGRATTAALVPPVEGANVAATYSGSALYAASGIGRLRVQVARGATTVSLDGSPSPSPLGAPVTFTARVTSPGAVPDGTVTFLRGGTTLGTVALDGEGVARLVVPGAALGAVGAKSIVATYSGSDSFRAGQGTRLHEVRATLTSVALVASANPSKFGAAVTFTATVASVAPGVGLPVGTVTFRRGQTVLATVRLDGQGRARLVVSGAALGAPGVKSIQAAYSGGTGFAPSTRAILQAIAL